jgi:hypothetical protein
MKRYWVNLLFPLILCFMIFGCSSSMSNQFMYGTQKEKPGKVLMAKAFLNGIYSDKWYSTMEDSANGKPTEPKILYNELLQSLDSKDTLGLLITSLGNANYIKYDGGLSGTNISLAFKANMNIYQFIPADALPKYEGMSWRLIKTEPIKFQIPELIGNNPLVIDSSGKRKVSTTPAKTIAVMDFSGIGLSTGEAQALSERLRLELFNVGSFKLLERGMMEQVLQEQGFQQSGCTDSECMVQVGNLIGVELMIGGSISKVGTVHSVSAKIFSVSTGEIVKTAQLDFRGDIGDLMLGGMRKIAEDLSDY